MSPEEATWVPQMRGVELLRQLGEKVGGVMSGEVTPASAEEELQLNGNLPYFVQHGDMFKKSGPIQDLTLEKLPISLPETIETFYVLGIIVGYLYSQEADHEEKP